MIKFELIKLKLLVSGVPRKGIPLFLCTFGRSLSRESGDFSDLARRRAVRSGWGWGLKVFKIYIWILKIRNYIIVQQFVIKNHMTPAERLIFLAKRQKTPPAWAHAHVGRLESREAREKPQSRKRTRPSRPRRKRRKPSVAEEGSIGVRVRENQWNRTRCRWHLNLTPYLI